ncbi:MAG: hypothetical protein KDD53_09160 [Bdellovibrionales bacterium]|nr:hypothetical protein [Bdellovibrionales bacterium]
MISGNYKRERGASLTEYTLAVALIAIISIASMQGVSTSVSKSFECSGKTISHLDLSKCGKSKIGKKPHP